MQIKHSTSYSDSLYFEEDPQVFTNPTSTPIWPVIWIKFFIDDLKFWNADL